MLIYLLQKYYKNITFMKYLIVILTLKKFMYIKCTNEYNK
nr:MAG TPA: hypothetical protein [Caudoviricetes sp.]